MAKRKLMSLEESLMQILQEKVNIEFQNGDIIIEVNFKQYGNDYYISGTSTRNEIYGFYVSKEAFQYIVSERNFK